MSEMLKWFKYPSLVNEKMKGLSPEKEDKWIVTEKIHGSNFAIHWVPEGGKFRYYSRNLEIGGDADFRGFKAKKFPFMDKIRESVTEEVIIWGEIYGCFFPGKKCEGGAIQRGIAYSPDLEFIGFDVLGVDGFLPFGEASKFCEGLGIDFVDPIFWGSLQEIKEWIPSSVNDFRTTRQKPGMDPTSPFFNPIAEGVVIRHCTSHQLIKWRSSNFRETTKSMKGQKLPTEPEEIVDDISDYLTEARLNNVRSKSINEFSLLHFKEYLDAMTEDVKAEMEDDGLTFDHRKHKTHVSKFLRGCLSSNHELASS